MNNLELLERLGIVDPPDLQVTSRVAAALDGAASAAPASAPRRHRRLRVRIGTLATFVGVLRARGRHSVDFLQWTSDDAHHVDVERRSRV